MRSESDGYDYHEEGDGIRAGDEWECRGSWLPFLPPIAQSWHGDIHAVCRRKRVEPIADTPKLSPLEEMNALMARMTELAQEAQSRLDRPERNPVILNPESRRGQTDATIEWQDEVAALLAMTRSITPDQAKEVEAKWLFENLNGKEILADFLSGEYGRKAIIQDAINWRVAQSKSREMEKKIAEQEAVIDELTTGAAARQGRIKALQETLRQIEDEESPRIKLLERKQHPNSRDFCASNYNVEQVIRYGQPLKWRADFMELDPTRTDKPLEEDLGRFETVDGAKLACLMHHWDRINLMLTQPLELAPESVFDQEPQEDRE